jgi:hypothetical protein
LPESVWYSPSSAKIKIASNPAICLESLIRDRQQELERKRQELTEQIARLESDPALAHVEKELAALAGFDSAAYQAGHPAGA